MNTFRTFATEQSARTYRHEHGTGGWIFTPEQPGESILFPPEMTPSAIFHHPMAKGQTGNLVGNG